MQRSTSQASNPHGAHDASINSLTVPISSRSQSYQSEHSASLSPSHPAFSSNSGPTSLPNTHTTSTPLFRGRAKTLASMGSSKNGTASPIAPQEVQLPKDPYVHGQPLEAYLYKDASECPICFMYYPPFLNRTRCCDQPICSECFVQIKRPDPHPPEHHDGGDTPAEPKPAEEEGLLVSEPSACPFCVTPEFGVTYECPPFRRGLAYAGPASGYPLSNPTSAMSSSTSLASAGPGRRRTTSLSASAPTVITTDRVRPDWAKKLADARAHALRRSAAATALHNAAYMLGNNGASDSRGFVLGRRRRNIFGDSPLASGSGTPSLPEGHPLGHLSVLLAQSERSNNADSDPASGRTGSRRNRIHDLEELMMMEAIRLSLAAEDDRKKKEDKESKKEEKKKAKDAKKAEKTAKKTGGMYSAGPNNSSSTWASMARSTSNLGNQPPSSPTTPIPGKGKAPISANTSSGFNPLSEPTSTLNTEIATSSNTSNVASGDAQRHLEESRANLNQPSQPIAFPDSSRGHGRHFSNASSIVSSVPDSAPNSYQQGSNFAPSANASGVNLDGESSTSDRQSGTPSNGAGLEPMFNFRSLAAMIGDEDKGHNTGEHLEFLSAGAEDSYQTPRNLSVASGSKEVDGNRGRGDSGESSSSSAPSEPPFCPGRGAYAGDQVTHGAEQEGAAAHESQNVDQKHVREVALNHTHDGQPAQ